MKKIDKLITDIVEEMLVSIEESKDSVGDWNIILFAQYSYELTTIVFVCIGLTYDWYGQGSYS